MANCGYGVGYSVFEVLDCVRRHTGKSFDIHLGDRRPGDAEFVVADPSLARALLDWLPRYDNLDTIVETSLSWEARRSDFEFIPIAANL